MDKGGLFGGAGTELIYDLSWTISCGGGSLNGYMARRGQKGCVCGGGGGVRPPPPPPFLRANLIHFHTKC